MSTKQRIHFGVRYRHIDLLEPLAAKALNEEEGISIKHWTLVFTPPSKSFAFTFEATPSGDEQGTICTPVGYHNGAVNPLPLGTFYGEWDDLIKILEVHPQRGSKYSPGVNNCQHFVATFLILLAALVDIRPKTWIEIEEPARYATVSEVLRNTNGVQIWNAFNFALARVMLMPIPLAGAAAYSAVTAFCTPLALGSMLLAGAASSYVSEKWERSTCFDNPSISGFPIRLHGLLTDKECSLPPSSQDGKSCLSSCSPPAALDTRSFDRSNGLYIPPVIDAVGASSLYQIAHGIFGLFHQTRDTGSFFMFF